MDKIIKVEFRIVDFTFDPSQITKELEITPTKTWNKGDLIVPNSKSILKYKTNGWEIDSGLLDNLYLENHFLKLSEILQLKSNKINRFSNLAQIEFACTIYLYYEAIVPVLHLSKTILLFINSLSAEVDIDIYQFPGSVIPPVDVETKGLV